MTPLHSHLAVGAILDGIFVAIIAMDPARVHLNAILCNLQ